MKTWEARECLKCHNKFTPKGNVAKYCSRKCCLQANWRRKSQEPIWRLKKLVAMAKNRAATKCLDFNIDIDYVLTLWNGKCAVTGIPLVMKLVGDGTPHPYAPSIDRITPKLGYVRGNIRIVCYQVNIAISEFGLEQFDKLVCNYMTHTRGTV